MAAFAWTKPRTEAARLLGATNLTYAEIAKEAGVSAITLAKWREIPEFAARVEEYEVERLSEAQRGPYARRADRVALLSDMANRLLDVCKARAVLTFPSERETEEYRRQGGATGLVQSRQKMLGSGEYGILITEFNVDTTLTKELRATLQQLAEELGQRGRLEVDTARGTIQVVFSERPDGPQ